MNKPILSLLVFAVFGSTNTLHAEEQEASAPQVSLELLEFLGDFSTAEDKWQDPLEVSRMLDETPVNVDEQTEKSE